jgi:hypothetical protein
MLLGSYAHFLSLVVPIARIFVFRAELALTLSYDGGGEDFWGRGSKWFVFNATLLGGCCDGKSLRLSYRDV